MTSPLSHIKVVDLSRMRTGPACVRMLSDWGAEVVAIDRRARAGEEDMFADRHGSDFQNLHRNKRSIVLDLKQPAAVEVVAKMIAAADVVVENFRPDVKHRLGLDYEAARKINPRIVYASISGFGQEGPYRNRPGVDQIAQGMSGLMSITGEPGRGPMRVGTAIADLSAGILCAYGILLALIERGRSGEGQWVTTSLLAAQISLLDFQAARYLMGGKVATQVGNNHPTGAPTNAYKTRNGHINIAATGNAMFRLLCKALGCRELALDTRYETPEARVRNQGELNGLIEARTEGFTSEELVATLSELGVPCGPIYAIDEVFADPQVKTLGIVGTVEHPELGPLNLVASPIKLSRSASRLETAAPELGADTDAVLAELGYDATAIAALRAANAAGA